MDKLNNLRLVERDICPFYQLKQREITISVLEAKLSNADMFSRYLTNKTSSQRTSSFGDESFGLRKSQSNHRSLMTEISDADTHNNSSMYLEATELDYLRQIIYSYMMGVDPITIAIVIVMVLKFSENERRKSIDNEKTKQSTGWFPVINNK